MMDYALITIDASMFVGSVRNDRRHEGGIRGRAGPRPRHLADLLL